MPGKRSAFLFNTSLIPHPSRNALSPASVSFRRRIGTSVVLPNSYQPITICKAGTRQQSRGSGIRPKQSLGQNFLRDQNTVMRIVQTFTEIHASEYLDTRVVEVGPGLGALTGDLMKSFNDLHVIEIDQRAVAHLCDKYSSLSVEHADVLDTNWSSLSTKLGAPLSVVGNLPYNIVSQILLSLLEAPSRSVRLAVVMMQREVAHRVIAKPRTKAYGILSVVSQLYAKPTILFNVPPNAFYPVPDVTSAMVQLDFIPHEDFDTSNVKLAKGLRTILKNAFGQRRKVLRNSLKTVCEERQVDLPKIWEDKRAEELTPIEFVQMTQLLFEKELATNKSESINGDSPSTVWR